MITFTAKEFHETPTQVYRAAVKEAVKITHAHHGDFYIMTHEHIERELDCQVHIGPNDISWK